MGLIFGKSKKPVSKVTDQDKAVLQLKKQRDMLKQYQQKILLTLDKEKIMAKTLLQEGKKDRAKLLLKKKRFQETLLQKSEAQLDNVERLVHDLEFANIEMKVLEGLKLGNDALKQVHDIMSIEDVEKILEETREGVEKQKEIDDLLSTNLSPEDLEEVETELEQIMAEANVPRDLSTLSPDSEEVVSLPEVPETSLPEVQQKERPAKHVEKVSVLAS
jgi:charged multivesicular body protein 6